ncbi:hypothetical protein D477_018731 [Arthrobacter crystallopoietes BAB-32]|uniref:STAS domain-containing protein n=1 Tax=Arthrobacter crystallopoietes BAB-32 TaxID=1246476 RepID=N1UXX3_9MICC|nr:hypothetical protein [Arthrobacter crystallopoietes]EMY32697.1 hypothetical protein D477_018731 [Arthrobacter crystallopoietes BAB-32]
MESDKLKVVVGVDVECNTARIEVKGHVDTRNIQALYSVARRANALTAGPALVLDLARASATPEALEQLSGWAEAGMLPGAAGADGTECDLRVVQPSGAAVAASGAADVALAA